MVVGTQVGKLKTGGVDLTPESPAVMGSDFSTLAAFAALLPAPSRS